MSLQSADPSIAPLVELNLLDDERDVVRLVEGLRRCAAVAGQAAMADYVGDRLLFTGDLDDDRGDGPARAGDGGALVSPRGYLPDGAR